MFHVCEQGRPIPFCSRHTWEEGDGWREDQTSTDTIAVQTRGKYATLKVALPFTLVPAGRPKRALTTLKQLHIRRTRGKNDKSGRMDAGKPNPQKRFAASPTTKGEAHASVQPIDKYTHLPDTNDKYAKRCQRHSTKERTAARKTPAFSSTVDVTFQTARSGDKPQFRYGPLVLTLTVIR